MVIVHCPADETGTGALEVVYQRDGEQIARNVQPLAGRAGQVQLPPGAGRARVRDATAPIEAHCRVDLGPVTVVPYTLLPPVD